MKERRWPERRKVLKKQNERQTGGCSMTLETLAGEEKDKPFDTTVRGSDDDIYRDSWKERTFASQLNELTVSPVQNADLTRSAHSVA